MLLDPVWSPEWALLHYATFLRAYTDYRMVSGFAVPHRMEVRWNGILTNRSRLASFLPSAKIPDSVFQVSAGYSTPTPPTPPAVMPVADGIAYMERIGGGYRMLVADTDEGPVVVAIALIEKTFPAIGSGAWAVEVINVGSTSHAASMLAVYVPAQRLLFQGDLLRINEHGGPVVSPEATRDLDRIIRRFRLDVHTIGAVHGLNGTMADLHQALRNP